MSKSTQNDNKTYAYYIVKNDKKLSKNQKEIMFKFLAILYNSQLPNKYKLINDLIDIVVSLMKLSTNDVVNRQTIQFDDKYTENILNRDVYTSFSKEEKQYIKNLIYFYPISKAYLITKVLTILNILLQQQPQLNLTTQTSIPKNKTQDIKKIFLDELNVLMNKVKNIPYPQRIKIFIRINNPKLVGDKSSSFSSFEKGVLFKPNQFYKNQYSEYVFFNPMVKLVSSVVNKNNFKIFFSFDKFKKLNDNIIKDNIFIEKYNNLYDATISNNVENNIQMTLSTIFNENNNIIVNNNVYSIMDYKFNKSNWVISGPRDLLNKIPLELTFGKEYSNFLKSNNIYSSLASTSSKYLYYNVVINLSLYLGEKIPFWDKFTYNCDKRIEDIRKNFGIKNTNIEISSLASKPAPKYEKLYTASSKYTPKYNSNKEKLLRNKRIINNLFNNMTKKNKKRIGGTKKNRKK